MTALLLFLAIIPGVYLLWKVYRLDHIEKEPKGLIAFLLFMGVLSVIPTIIVEMALGGMLESFVSEGYFYLFIENFFCVALIEEIFKFLAMKIPTWKHKAFNYRFDAVVYAISATLGFAVVENILYCLDGGLTTALMRMVLGVPGHVIYAIFMGYYYGLAKKSHTLGWKKQSKKYLRRAIWIPTLIHGLDDFCLSSENEYILLVYIVYLIALYIFAFRMEKTIAKQDECIAFRLRPLKEEAASSMTQCGNYQDVLKNNGYILPAYNRDAMVQRTKEAPDWIHVGIKNSFVDTLINMDHYLLNTGAVNKGIILAEGADYELISKRYRNYDNYSFSELVKDDGTTSKYAIGSVAETCIMDETVPSEYGRLKEIFAKPSLQLVTFTLPLVIYDVSDDEGKLLPAATNDFNNGPGKCQSYMGKITELLYHRYKEGQMPLAMVSLDDIANNGDRLFTVINAYALEWHSKGFIDEGFINYIKDKTKITFPNTIVDRESKKLIVWDEFPNGRPALQKGGVNFVVADENQNIGLTLKK